MAVYKAVSTSMENMGFLPRTGSNGEQVYYGAYSKIGGEDKHAIEAVAPDSVFSNFNYSLAVFSKEEAKAILEDKSLLDTLQKYHVETNADATRGIIEDVETSRRNYGELMGDIYGEEFDADALYYDSLGDVVSYEPNNLPVVPSNDMIAEAAKEMDSLKEAGLQPEKETSNAGLAKPETDIELNR